MMNRGGSSTRSNNTGAHHSRNQSGQHGHGHPQQHRKPNKQEPPGVDLICKVKYTNTLPDLPFEPKFLQSPFVGLNRFVNYKPSTLEKNFKYELLTEPDMNVKIDLIDPSTYQLDQTAEKPPLHPIDEQLLEDESVSQLNTKRSMQHRKLVPWMRKTEYIGTEFNRYGLGQTGAERPDTKVGYGTKRRVKEEPFEYKDRQAQLNAIERTFAEAKKPIRKHYSRPGVVAVEECPIFPDFELWKYAFAQVIFDADPLPYCKTRRQEKLEQSILKGMADSEGHHLVGYFSPFDEALVQRMADDAEELGSYQDNHEYQYKLEREYNWSVQNKATKGYEQENYFLTRRGNSYCYNELETRVKLARRAKSSGIGAKSATILSILHRPFNSQEQSQMEHRTNGLFGIQEEEAEDEEEENQEVQEGDNGEDEEEDVQQDRNEANEEENEHKEEVDDGGPVAPSSAPNQDDEEQIGDGHQKQQQLEAAVPGEEQHGEVANKTSSEEEESSSAVSSSSEEESSAEEKEED